MVGLWFFGCGSGVRHSISALSQRTSVRCGRAVNVGYLRCVGRKGYGEKKDRSEDGGLLRCKKGSPLAGVYPVRCDCICRLSGAKITINFGLRAFVRDFFREGCRGLARMDARQLKLRIIKDLRISTSRSLHRSSGSTGCGRKTYGCGCLAYPCLVCQNGASSVCPSGPAGGTAGRGGNPSVPVGSVSCIIRSPPAGSAPAVLPV